MDTGWPRFFQKKETDDAISRLPAQKAEKKREFPEVDPGDEAFGGQPDLSDVCGAGTEGEKDDRVDAGELSDVRRSHRPGGGADEGAGDPRGSALWNPREEGRDRLRSAGKGRDRPAGDPGDQGEGSRDPGHYGCLPV